MLIKLNYTHDTKEKLVMDEEGTRLLKDGKVPGGGIVGIQTLLTVKSNVQDTQTIMQVRQGNTT